MSVKRCQLPVQIAEGQRDRTSNEIDIVSLTTCEVSSDGYHIRLNFENALGLPGKLRLTNNGVQQLVMTLPQLLSRALQAQYGDGSVRAVFPLGRWRLETAVGSEELILTMMTPDGFEVAFSVSAPAITEMSGPAATQNWRRSGSAMWSSRTCSGTATSSLCIVC